MVRILLLVLLAVVAAERGKALEFVEISLLLDTANLNLLAANSRIPNSNVLIGIEVILTCDLQLYSC